MIKGKNIYNGENSKLTLFHISTMSTYALSRLRKEVKIYFGFFKKKELN